MQALICWNNFHTFVFWLCQAPSTAILPWTHKCTNIYVDRIQLL